MAETGLCADGEQEKLLADGATEIHGSMPVNTDGGLIANGEPIGASGLRQVHELVRQLRGEAGERQVPGNPRVGLAQVYGALGTASATILSLLTACPAVHERAATAKNRRKSRAQCTFGGKGLYGRAQHVVGVADDVAVALLGQEALPVRGVFGVQAVARHHRIEDGAAAVGLGPQQPAQPLRLLLA